MTTYKTITVGKPLDLNDLQKKPTPPGKRISPRDEDLGRLISAVSRGPEHEVMPWHYEGQAATARAAAARLVKAAGVTVYVSSRPDMPGVLLFSGVALSGRQGKG